MLLKFSPKNSINTVITPLYFHFGTYQIIDANFVSSLLSRVTTGMLSFFNLVSPQKHCLTTLIHSSTSFLLASSTPFIPIRLHSSISSSLLDQRWLQTLNFDGNKQLNMYKDLEKKFFDQTMLQSSSVHCMIKYIHLIKLQSKGTPYVVK